MASRSTLADQVPQRWAILPLVLEGSGLVDIGQEWKEWIFTMEEMEWNEGMEWIMD